MDFSCKRSRTPRPKKSGVDRLSALSDDVLHRIFSSVDFLDIVRTSVLSKRWRHVWKSMPYLNFNFESFLERYDDKRYVIMPPIHMFWDFVKWTLLLRDDSQIKRISLSCDSTITDQFNGLLRVAAKQKIQELCFRDELYTAKELEFPPVLCETLTDLNLSFRYDIALRLMAVFTNLRTLYLSGVVISCDVAEKLLSCDCIKLENVHLEDCQVGREVEVVNISACNLKTLTIVNVCSWVKMWPCISFDTKHRICAPNLVSFCYTGPMLRGFEMVNVVSLKHVIIRLLRLPEVYLGDHSLCPERFIGFNHTKALTLSTFVVKSFSPAYSEFLWDTFILDNLNSLEVELRYTVDHIEGLINLLKCTPNLESLDITFKEIPWSLSNTRKAIESRRSPWKSKIEEIPCLSYHVKMVRISNLDGSEFGLELVNFLLQNGEVLEKMEIRHNSRVIKQRSLNRIVALPKPSSDVVICLTEYAKRRLTWFDGGDSDPEDDEYDD